MLAKSLRILTSSPIFLSFNSSLVVLFAFFLYGINISFIAPVAAFFATFSVYALNKITDTVEDSINRPEDVNKNTNKYLILSGVAVVLSLIIGALDGPWTDLVLITPLVVGVFYSVKFSEKVPRLKEVVGVKSLLVAFSWAFTGSLLPALEQSVSAEQVLLVFYYIFFSLMVNTILFDVLDLKGDKVGGVRTIPSALGLRNTKIFLCLMNSCLVACLIYCNLKGLFLGFMPSLVFGILYGYFLIGYFMDKQSNRLKAQLMIDGEWIPLMTILNLFLK